MSQPQVNREIMQDIFTRATKANRTDEKFRSMLMQGKIAIMYYTMRGQEVLAAAAMTALNPDDYLVTNYRGQHDQIAKGVPLDLLYAECIGKATGTCKGKGGSMHITHPKTGVMVTTGVVGSGIPIANGLAMASQNNGDGRVTVVTFGDGASNIGGCHEAMNMAQLYGLPVIFLCQNNRYGEHTAFADHTKSDNIASRAAGYGMKGVTVDGNDAESMYLTMKEAVDRARTGGGPTLIEAMCYRMMGHFFGADFSYMPPEHLEAMQREDPMPKIRARMLELQFTETELDEIIAKVDAEVDAAMQFALDSPFPDPSELRIDVFEEEIAA